MPQTKNICDFQGSSEPIFGAQFFIGHLTLSQKNTTAPAMMFIHIIATGCHFTGPIAFRHSVSTALAIELYRILYCTSYATS